MEEAMKVQARHLAFYEEILKPKYYAEVKAEADRLNEIGYESPYDVFRGNDIDNFVANILRK